MSLAVTIQAADERAVLREKFLTDNKASTDLSNVLGNDASFRTYYRLTKPTQTLLMDSPAAHEPVAPFVKIAKHLKSMDISAPEIVAEDSENNFLIIEDFGTDMFSTLMEKGDKTEDLYGLAVDVLAHLHNHSRATWVDIPEYTTESFIEETGRTLNWYYPVIAGEKPSQEMKKRWVEAWTSVFKALPAIENTLVLRDFHCDNLMLIDGRDGMKACGVLDFQDGLIGAMPYDLVSILENDRRAVPEDMQQRLLNRYFEKANVKDRGGFMQWYRVLSAQRQSKILGLFYRLYIRDGKQGYLKFIPQVCHLLNQSLKDPILAPVATLYKELFGDILKPAQEVDLKALQSMELNDNLAA